jgi:type I restriction enzyme S subunit
MQNDELIFAIDNLPALLEIPGGIEHAKNTILTAGFTGQLLPQDDGDEPAAALLNRMAGEKSEAAELGRRRKSKGRGGSFGPALADIPDSWQWVQLQDCSSKIEYGYTASAQSTGAVQMLRITDLQAEGIDWSTVPYCEISSVDEAKYRVLPGDILFARTGGTVGKSHLMLDEKRSVFASYLIRLRTLPALNVDFIAMWLQSADYWRQIYAGVSGTGQPNFNGSKLSQLSIALPPRNEQDRIVSLLSEVLDKLREAEQVRTLMFGRA